MDKVLTDLFRLAHSLKYRVLNNHYASPSRRYEKIVPRTILYQMKAREKLHPELRLEKVQLVKLLRC